MPNGSGMAYPRALASSPQIILFDEPTSALDPEMIGEVLQVMKNLAHSGITMLVVTHEMQFARAIASRVLFLDDGRIVEEAPPADFFDHPQTERAQRFLRTFTLMRLQSSEKCAATHFHLEPFCLML